MADHLTAVGPDFEPEKPILSVSDAALHGTRLDELVQMRRVIARAIDDESTSARDLAALTRRQIEISKEIEGLRREWAEEARENEVSGDEKFSASAI